MAKFVAIYGSIALIACVLAGIIAAVKRRDASYWMTLTLLFPPAIVMLVLMEKHKGPRTRSESMEAQDERQLAKDERD